MRQNGELFEIDIMRLVGALWDRFWLLILAGIAGGVIAFLYSAFLITPLYQSNVLLYVNNNSINVGSISVSGSDLSTSSSLVNTYIVILKSRNTLEAVIDEANLDYEYNTLSNMVSAESVNGTGIFRVTVTDADPQEAATIANTIAIILPDKVAEVLEGSSMRIVDYAVVPDEKSSPNITKNAVMGFVIGLLIMMVLICLQEILDDVIHDTSDIVDDPAYEDIPILSEIPDLTAVSTKIYGYAKAGGKGENAYAYAEAARNMKREGASGDEQ